MDRRAVGRVLIVPTLLGVLLSVDKVDPARVARAGSALNAQVPSTVRAPMPVVRRLPKPVPPDMVRAEVAVVPEPASDTAAAPTPPIAPRPQPVEAITAQRAPRPAPTPTPLPEPAPVATPVAAPVPVPVASPTPVSAAEPAPAPTASAAPAPVAAQSLSAHERVGLAALARVPFDWQRSGYRVVFEPGRAGYLGETNPHTKTVTIWIRDGMSSDKVLSTLVHELMHALDFSGHVLQRERDWWMVVRGISQWPAGCYCNDRTRGVGDLAEAAVWVVIPSQAQLMLGPLDDIQTRLVRQILGMP